ASRELTNHRWKRISAGEMSWSGVLCPTPAHAQDAEMSLSDYESFVYRACHVEEEGDAVAHWQSTSADLAARAEQLSTSCELRVEDGVVVAAEAARGEEFLEAVLGLDDGARRLGEVAFGMNYEIDRFTKNILFDEKIGGTMHVALGSAFKELGGVNDSALHWDLVCDLRAEGEVYADGELVWRAGSFLEQATPATA